MPTAYNPETTNQIALKCKLMRLGVNCLLPNALLEGKLSIVSGSSIDWKRSLKCTFTVLRRSFLPNKKGCWY